jgi:hypothetical protein
VQRCKLGDTLGLLLENGTLTVYKKGAPTGPPQEGKGRYNSDGLLVPTYGPPTWDSSVPSMTRLGVAAWNLTGEMYWAGSVCNKWDSLRAQVHAAARARQGRAQEEEGQHRLPVEGHGITRAQGY